MKTSKRMFVTIDDLRRANAQVTGEIRKPVLSDEDRALFGRVKLVVGSIEDSPRLRKLYRNATVR